MTNKRCKDWCDTFASVYPVKSYCSDECKSAGRSVNEKDKPEAGRTCANWKDCGKYSVSAREKLWCSFECRDAALNPAPSPVERCSCEEATRYKAALTQLLFDVDAGRGCQCVAYDNAERCGANLCRTAAPLDYLERIARRALALGGENSNG